MVMVTLSAIALVTGAPATGSNSLVPLLITAGVAGTAAVGATVVTSVDVNVGFQQRIFRLFFLSIIPTG